MTNAHDLQQQGISLFQQKEYEQAATRFADARTAYEEAGQPDMAAEMAVNLGLTQRALGQPQRALELMQEALATFQAVNDARRTAMVLGNLGGVYVALNDKEQAADAYREAADIFDELGEKKLHGETLLAIAQLQLSDRKIGSAASTYEAGLAELDDLSASQKMLKGLIGFRNRLIGGGASESASADKTPSE